MKNWKKLLACLLVGLMALTVFTACDASVGAPMSPKRSDAESESVKALCDTFKGVTYDKDLSEKAYYVAYWVAGTSPSCSVNKEKTELSRKNSVDNVAKTYLNQGYYASAFDSMGIGKGIGGGMAKDDFTPGFDIKPDPNSTSDIIFVLPKDGTYPEAMTKAAKGQDQTGRCLCGKGRRKLRCGAVWVNFITTNKAAAARESAAAALFMPDYQPFRKAGRGLPSLSHW